MLDDEIPTEIIFDQLEMFEAQSSRRLIFEDILMEFHEDTWFMHRDEQDVMVKAKKIELFEGALSLFQEELESEDQNVVNARGMVHHQWRPPEVVDDLASNNTLNGKQTLPFE